MRGRHSMHANEAGDRAPVSRRTAGVTTAGYATSWSIQSADNDADTSTSIGITTAEQQQQQLSCVVTRQGGSPQDTFPSTSRDNAAADTAPPTPPQQLPE